MTHRAQILKPGDVSLGQAHEFMIAFGKSGGNFELLQRAIEKPLVMDRVVEVMSNQSASQKMARLIMGLNFRSIEDVEFALHHNFSRSELSALENIPYTEEVLIKSRDTHLLIPYFETTLLSFISNVPEVAHKENDWFISHPFVSYEMVRTGWRLVLKECADDSCGKMYGNQLRTLSSEYENMRAIDFVYVLVLEMRLQRNRQFLEYWSTKMWARTKSLSSESQRVHVYLRDNRVWICNPPDGGIKNLGLAVSREHK